MNDLSEEDLLAQAIALSLQSQGVQNTTTTTNGVPHTPPPDVTQQHDLRNSETQPSPTPARQEVSIGDWSPPLGQKPPQRAAGSSSSQGILAGSQQVTTGPGSTVLPGVELSSIHSVRQWEPNPECLELVMGMGISTNAARRALYHTGNDNAELAVAWVFENINKPDLHDPFEPPPLTVTQPPQTGPVFHSFDELQSVVLASEATTPKMVFVVNTELRMGVGKIAAQVGHATLALYRHLQGQTERQADFKDWEDGGSKKIVLKGENHQQLLELKRKAYELHVPNVIVHDAGRTQVEPGSLTVFALFDDSSTVDKVTGALKLL